MPRTSASRLLKGIRDFEAGAAGSHHVLGDQHPLASLDLESPAQRHLAVLPFREQAADAKRPCQLEPSARGPGVYTWDICVAALRLPGFRAGSPSAHIGQSSGA